MALKACETLRGALADRGGLTVDTVKAMSPEELGQHINSVNYYKGKADKIVGCALELARAHRDTVPTQMESLLRLPGVGPKIAHLVLSVCLPRLASAHLSLPKEYCSCYGAFQRDGAHSYAHYHGACVYADGDLNFQSSRSCTHSLVLFVHANGSHDGDVLASTHVACS